MGMLFNLDLLSYGMLVLSTFYQFDNRDKERQKLSA